MNSITYFPSCQWLIRLDEKQKYTGSVGTGETGLFTVHTLHYAVWCAAEEDPEGNGRKVLKVTSHIVPPLYSGKEPFGFEEASFPATEEGAEEAREWLEACIGRYDCIGEK